MPDWIEVLKENCQVEWDKHGKVLILSRIPPLLEDAGVDVKGLLGGQKLRPFLLTNAAGNFQIFQSERNDILWGIAPLLENLAEPFDKYFPKSPAPHATRFAPSFWKAFTSPLAPGKRRWVTDEPSIRFADLDTEVAPQSGSLEIERRFVLGLDEDSEVDTAAMLQNIAAWGTDNKVDTGRFALGRKKAPVPKAPAATSDARSALDQLLDILHPSETARISMPLDVVARLASTKVKGEA